MKQLIVSKETFGELILALIQSGVTFDAYERNGNIVIDFTGGF